SVRRPSVTSNSRAGRKHLPSYRSRSPAKGRKGVRFLRWSPAAPAVLGGPMNSWNLAASYRYRYKYLLAGVPILIKLKKGQLRCSNEKCSINLDSFGRSGGRK